jgi:hypothetical protein
MGEGDELVKETVQVIWPYYNYNFAIAPFRP